jgi:hypothetical protein
LDIYQDLLALPSTGDTEVSVPHNEVSQVEKDQATVLAMDQRLVGAALDLDSSSSPVANSLQHRRTPDLTQVHNTGETVHMGAAEHDILSRFDQPYQRIISRLKTTVAQLDAVQKITSSKMVSQGSIPITILADHEWLSLVRTCVGQLLFPHYSLLTKSRSVARAGRGRGGPNI